MDLEKVKKAILTVIDLAAWPEMAVTVERVAERLQGSWRLPFLACKAVGGDPDRAIPGAAAIGCMQISIILVDDMLDDDPKGEYLRLGYGPAANLALAFQAAAFRCIEAAPIDLGRKTPILEELARMAFQTALGQHRDAQEWGNEEDYWRVVRNKSTPFYGAAFFTGALLGEADFELARQLQDFGLLLGEIIQLYDDLMDAFHEPARPDWKRQWNNLVILYALTADHPDRERLRSLLPDVEDVHVLREAQQVLIRSGAVSYCAYHLIERQREAIRRLEAMVLVDPEELADLIFHQIEPLMHLFRRAGIELPPDVYRERR